MPHELTIHDDENPCTLADLIYFYFRADQRSGAGRMAGEADAVSKPAGKLSGRVEPLKDFDPGGDVSWPVQTLEHLMAAGKEVALTPVWTRIEALGEGVLVAP